MPDDHPLAPATIAVTAGRPSAPGDPLNQPIVLASNFRSGGEYARTHGTDTWAALETAVGVLEGGRAIAYSSGMAAASAIVFALTPKIVVIPTVSYMGVRSLLSEYQSRGQVELRPVDITDTTAVANAAQGADVVWVETPTNPTLDVADLPAIGAATRDAGASMVVDSTFATPLLQRPLEHGAAFHCHQEGRGGLQGFMHAGASRRSGGWLHGRRSDSSWRAAAMARATMSGRATTSLLAVNPNSRLPA